MCCSWILYWSMVIRVRYPSTVIRVNVNGYPCTWMGCFATFDSPKVGGGYCAGVNIRDWRRSVSCSCRRRNLYRDFCCIFCQFGDIEYSTLTILSVVRSDDRPDDSPSVLVVCQG